MKGLLLGSVLVVFLLLPECARAQAVRKGMSICADVQSVINVLVDFTRTSCWPAKGTAPGTYSFILVSSKPVFSVESAKKAWLLVSIAAVGDALNRNPSVKADDLWLSDSNLMKSRIAYEIRAATAKSLQRRIKENRINLEAMYAQVSRGLKRSVIPGKK